MAGFLERRDGLVALDIHPLCTQSLPDTEAPLRDAVRSICRAMAAFRSRGFAHRDVRWPSCLQHVSGRWCVADFELAEAAGEPLPAEAIAEAFLPPEVLLDSGGLQRGSGNMYRIGRLCVEWSVAQHSPHSAAAQQHVVRPSRAPIRRCGREPTLWYRRPAHGRPRLTRRVLVVLVRSAV